MSDKDETEKQSTEAQKFYNRVGREYVRMWPTMLADLEMYACENPKEQKWFLGYLCAYGPDEFGLDFMEFCDLLAEDIRKGSINLSSRQYREILKCERSLNRVSDLFYELEEIPNITAEEVCTRLVDHPLWKDLSEQARKTLQLLRK